MRILCYSRQVRFIDHFDWPRIVLKLNRLLKEYRLVATASCSLSEVCSCRLFICKYSVGLLL